ncbi:MAG: replicative DNA helicase [Bacilli bacterium]
MELKQQPHNKDAEQYVLGAMCLSKNAINVARDRLDVDDFYYPNHQVIFAAIERLVDAKMPIDVVVLTDDLTRNELIHDAGGVDYIARIVAYTASAANIDSYVKIVEEKALLRKLITTSEDIGNMAFNSDEEIKDILDKSEQLILSVVKKRQSTEFKTVSDVLRDVRKNLEYLQTVDGNVTGIPTNFIALDKMTNGLNPNELIILAARPAMGKTAFALNICQNIALNTDKAVALFSLEMGADQLMNRFISSVGQIDASKLRVGKLDGKEWDQLNSAMAKLSNAKLYLDDSAGITVGEIRAKCRRLAAREDIGLVVIDYLQLITGSARAAAGGRQNEVSEISRMLKLMALELGVPVIALSQLSRGVESREDKRPLMSDLRESGSIEQDADIVMFLYRDDYYTKESTNDNVSNVEVLIAKHRSGPTGKIDLSFVKNYSKFTNVVYNDDGF